MAGLLDLVGKAAIIANDAAKEYKYPGYLARKKQLELAEQESARQDRELQLREDESRLRKSHSDLDMQLTLLKTLEPGSEAFYAALEGIQGNPAFMELKKRIAGKNMKYSGAPYGVDDNKMKELNNLKVQSSIDALRNNTPTLSASDIKNITAAMKNISDKYTPEQIEAGALDRDPQYQVLSKMFGGENILSGENVLNKPGIMSEKPKTLADMLADEPQETIRKGWWIFGDDTISPASVKMAAEKRVEALQLNEGLSRDEARRRVALEYQTLVDAENSDLMKRYPVDVDIAQYFNDIDKRRDAIQSGQTVLDTGDGVQTTKPKLKDLGINTPNMQEQFQMLEKIVGNSVPGLDIRQMYSQNREFVDTLLKAINDGVPDGKGGKRKLTEQEIQQIIAEEYNG